MATVTTMVIVYIFTGDFAASLGVGAVEVIAKILFYYLHERAWEMVSWGKAKHPLASIPVNRELTPEDMHKVTQQLKDLGYNHAEIVGRVVDKTDSEATLSLVNS